MNTIAILILEIETNTIKKLITIVLKKKRFTIIFVALIGIENLFS